MKLSTIRILFLACFLFSAFQQVAQAQRSGWQALDQGLRGLPSAACFWHDTLYAVSLPSQYDGLLCRWTGTRWDTVARMETMQHFLVNRMAVYRDELYLVGYFEHINELDNTKSVVRWNGSRFQGAGEGLKHALLPNVTDAVVHNDRLYVCGPFSTVGDSGAAPRLAYWNGQSWRGVFQSVVGTIEGLVVNGGQLYAYGSLDSINGQATGNLIRIEENGWANLENPQAENKSASLKTCVASAGKLWFFGDFGTGGETRYAWAEWTSEGWSLRPNDDAQPPTAAQGAVRVNDTLLVAYGYDIDDTGAFNQMNLSRYLADASPLLPAQLNGSVQWMLSRGDTLYAGGSFNEALNNGERQPLPGGVARWILSEPSSRSNNLAESFRIFQPVAGTSLLQKPEALSGHLEIYDLAGRLLASHSLLPGTASVELPETLPNGLYLLRVFSGERNATLRWLKF